MKQAALIAASLGLLACVAESADISALRQAELLNLLKHDCGSCHGLTLKGGLGPALTAEALKQKPLDLLTATILYGRTGTPMPPWRPFLTDSEAAWIASWIKEGRE